MLSGRRRLASRVALGRSALACAACLSISLAILMGLTGRCSAEAMLRIDMEGETALVKRQAVNPRTHVPEERVYLRQADRDVSTTTDTGTPYSLFVTGIHYKGAHGLGVRIDRERRPADVNQKSKIEINISRHDDDALDRKYHGYYILRNGMPHYLGFAFLMDRELYETPSKWLLHFQVWQCCTDAQPPLALQVLPQRLASESVRFVLMKRTDQYLDRKPTSDNGERVPFLDGKSYIDLEKGQWHQFIFMMRPLPAEVKPASAPTIAMWVDGRMVLQHFGIWGYSLQSERNLRNGYAVKIGVYRAAQNTMQQFYFDTIRWGNSFSSVNPDQP